MGLQVVEVGVQVTEGESAGGIVDRPALQKAHSLVPVWRVGAVLLTGGPAGLLRAGSSCSRRGQCD